MTRRVLITAPYFLPVLEDYRRELESHAIELVTVSVHERLNEADLLPLVDDIDGTICGDDQYTERVLRAARRLRVISKWGTGTDSIDEAAAARLGIRICNTVGAFTDPVADTVLGYILCFARQLPWMDRDIRDGCWRKRDTVALNECTLGIVGVGHIGKAVARRARACGMRLLGNDPRPMPAAFLAETGLTMVPLRDLLEEADFISLNCDLNPTSRRLVGRRELAHVRSTAYLINTARGAVVDESALIEVLRERRLAGAALDVFEDEPLPADSPLRSMGNCLLAPHNANGSRSVRDRVHRNTVDNLIDGLTIQ
jgi:D-3-phosphoglycerate dehydrogenase